MPSQGNSKHLSLNVQYSVNTVYLQDLLEFLSSEHESFGKVSPD